MSKSEFTTHEFIITEDQIGIRLDKAILFHDVINSRSQATKLLKNKLVTVNNELAKSSYLTQINDCIVFKVPVAYEDISDLQPYDINLNIVFEDDHLLVINKPAGLVMHPSVGHNSDSLVNALINKNMKLSSTENEKRPGIVHRIDKDTSGLVVVAKTNVTHADLAQQFKLKKVHRVYHAITFGYFKDSSGIIESYLIRHPKDRKKFSNERLADDTSEAKGKYAKTHYQVLNQYKGVSLVKCQLETGRTHQIRVHLSELIHPIVNDPIYSSSRQLANIQSKHVRNHIKSLNGIGLLAKELGFVHPITKEELMFKCLWPDDTLPLLNFLEWANE